MVPLWWLLSAIFINIIIYYPDFECSGSCSVGGNLPLLRLERIDRVVSVRTKY